LAVFLKAKRLSNPIKSKTSFPHPLDIATCMYYTGTWTPLRKSQSFIATKMRDRKTQRALMQFFKPENYFEVREALRSVNRHRLDRRWLRRVDSSHSTQAGAGTTAACSQHRLGWQVRSHHRKPIKDKT
jgi:hypothetical protein